MHITVTDSRATLSQAIDWARMRKQDVDPRTVGVCVPVRLQRNGRKDHFRLATNWKNDGLSTAQDSIKFESGRAYTKNLAGKLVAPANTELTKALRYLRTIDLDAYKEYNHLDAKLFHYRESGDKRITRDPKVEAELVRGMGKIATMAELLYKQYVLTVQVEAFAEIAN